MAFALASSGWIGTPKAVGCHLAGPDLPAPPEQLLEEAALHGDQKLNQMVLALGALQFTLHSEFLPYFFFPSQQA